MIGIKDIFALLGRLAVPASGTYAERQRVRRPTGAALRNPAEPFQAGRIEAARLKRAVRADKLQRNSAFSARNNAAHYIRGAMPVSLNPFHIAK